MVNEAVLLYELEPPIPMTVANATGIAKGAILEMTDPFTAATATTEGGIIAGIAAEEKVASDGKTKLGVYRRGFFKVIASGSIAVGDTVGSDGDGSQNYTYKVSSTDVISGSRTLGLACETATDEETYVMELNIGCN
jgi:hypothetical protein